MRRIRQKVCFAGFRLNLVSQFFFDIINPAGAEVDIMQFFVFKLRKNIKRSMFSDKKIKNFNYHSFVSCNISTFMLHFLCGNLYATEELCNILKSPLGTIS